VHDAHGEKIAARLGDPVDDPADLRRADNMLALRIAMTRSVSMPFEAP
jgi:hypothetical protein